MNDQWTQLEMRTFAVPLTQTFTCSLRRQELMKPPAQLVRFNGSIVRSRSEPRSDIRAGSSTLCGLVATETDQVSDLTAWTGGSSAVSDEGGVHAGVSCGEGVSGFTWKHWNTERSPGGGRNPGWRREKPQVQEGETPGDRSHVGVRVPTISQIPTQELTRWGELCYSDLAQRQRPNKYLSHSRNTRMNKHVSHVQSHTRIHFRFYFLESLNQEVVRIHHQVLSVIDQIQTTNEDTKFSSHWSHGELYIWMVRICCRLIYLSQMMNRMTCTTIRKTTIIIITRHSSS